MIEEGGVLTYPMVLSEDIHQPDDVLLHGAQYQLMVVKAWLMGRTC